MGREREENPTQGPEPLKYLFTAFYRDQTRFEQKPDDVSWQDPTKSAYYDVRQADLVCFGLANAEHAYAVDLIDGHFEIDGTPFWVEQPTGPLKLVFYRRHQHDFNAAGKQLDHRVRYFLGWTGKVGEAEATHTISVD